MVYFHASISSSSPLSPSKSKVISFANITLILIPVYHLPRLFHRNASQSRPPSSTFFQESVPNLRRVEVLRNCLNEETASDMTGSLIIYALVDLSTISVKLVN
ncbi:hypothetical protein L2E82_48460 [Cichorium intybus]|uniref:Uncharacterized protein n=1 Tax=Cichorium intybus TaxID=13427 RepID=A0ACB8YZF7_CICIN|nr:hypothetical protein L2E82_48460 [Cichorium intybus]